MVLFCVQQNEEIQTGLEQQNFKFYLNYPFKPSVHKDCVCCICTRALAQYIFLYLLCAQYF